MKEIRGKIVVALILFLSSGLLGVELLQVRLVQKKNIECDAKQIGQLLFKHRMIKISLTTASSIAHLMEFYRFYQFLCSKCLPSSVVEPSASFLTTYHEFEPNVGEYSPLVRGVIQTVVGIKNLLISKESCYALLLGSSAVATQKLMADVNHPHTMTWFIYKKIPYKKMFGQACKYAQLLDCSTLDKEKKFYYKQTLNSLCNQVVRSVEQLCGFMFYKSIQLAETEQKEAESIACYLSHCTNSWSRVTNKLFSQEIFDPQQFIKHATGFQEELQREISHFACVEGEKAIDVLQVINMDKQL